MVHSARKVLSYPGADFHVMSAAGPGQGLSLQFAASMTGLSGFSMCLHIGTNPLHNEFGE